MEQESSCIVVLGVPCQFALQHSGFLHCAGTVWELRSQVRPQCSCQVRAQGLHGWSGIIFSLKLCMYRKSLVSRLGLFSFFFVFPFQFFSFLFGCNNVLHSWLISFCALILTTLQLDSPGGHPSHIVHKHRVFSMPYPPECSPAGSE